MVLSVVKVHFRPVASCLEWSDHTTEAAKQPILLSNMLHPQYLAKSSSRGCGQTPPPSIYVRISASIYRQMIAVNV